MAVVSEGYMYRAQVFYPMVLVFFYDLLQLLSRQCWMIGVWNGTVGPWDSAGKRVGGTATRVYAVAVVQRV